MTYESDCGGDRVGDAVLLLTLVNFKHLPQQQPLPIYQLSQAQRPKLTLIKLSTVNYLNNKRTC